MDSSEFKPPEPYPDTIQEILELARDILDRGPDKGCTRIRIEAAGVVVAATFELPAPSFSAPEAKTPSIALPGPDTVKFPGEA